MTNPNDPAFHPTVCDPAFYDPAYRDKAYLLEPSGLTKREYFAALAMQGILANKLTVADVTFEMVAIHSVKQADALIAELSK